MCGVCVFKTIQRCIQICINSIVTNPISKTEPIKENIISSLESL